MKEEAAEAAEELKAKAAWVTRRTTRLVLYLPKLTKKLTAACVIQ